MHQKYIGIFGMMGSGKSVIINEYLFERPAARLTEFIPPPVEAKFKGMDFEFVDQIFALQSNDLQFNFYELDAPTINKWTQFIKVADAIIVVYNAAKNDYFESSDAFIANIRKYSTSSVPLFFVVNNSDTKEDAEEQVEDTFNISQLVGYSIDIRHIPPARVEFTKKHGRRVYVDISILDSLYTDVMKALS